jgi:hypothetical protein
LFFSPGVSNISKFSIVYLFGTLYRRTGGVNRSEEEEDGTVDKVEECKESHQGLLENI